MAYLMAGVGSIQLFDPSTNALILTSKTLTDEGVSFSSTAEEARGGLGNGLLGKYYHDTTFGLNLTDQLFDLQYLALNCGGAIEASADVIANEQVTVAVANQITVSQTPVEFNGSLVGWVKKSTEGDNAYRLVNFTGKIASVADAKVGDIYCVKYFYNNSTARKFTVNSAFIPSVVHAIATFPLFRSGTSTEAFTSSSQVGEIQVEIPAFQLEGAQELSLTSGGFASATLNGSALVTYSGNTGCSDNGYYAEVKEIIYGKGDWDNVVNLAVADSDIDLAPTETQTLVVYAIYSDGTVPKIVDNSLLTFTSGDDNIATVSAGGVVTAVAEGTANIEIVATAKTSLSAYAVATVTA